MDVTVQTDSLDSATGKAESIDVITAGQTDAVNTFGELATQSSGVAGQSFIKSG